MRIAASVPAVPLVLAAVGASVPALRTGRTLPLHLDGRCTSVACGGQKGQLQ